MTMAQNGLVGRYNVSYLDQRSGLPHNFVNDIFTDSRGFVWVAIYGGGLVRYDGYGFMMPQQVQSGSLGSNSCKSVAEDGCERLWVAYDEGTSIISLRTMQSVVPQYGDSTIGHILRQSASRVKLDSRKAIWLATGPQIHRITMGADGRVEHVSSYNYRGNTPEITLLDIEENGTVWANIDGGLYRLAERGGRLVREDISSLMSQLQGLYVTDLQKRNGCVWISTNEGLFRYDPVAQQLQRFRHTADSGSLSHDYATCLELTRENQLVVGTLGGVNLYDEVTGTFEHWSAADAGCPLSSDFVHCMMARNGQLWIGTETAGLVKLTPRHLALTNYVHTSLPGSLSPNPVNAMYVEADGTLWAGTVEGGLNRKLAWQEEFTHITRQNSALSHNSVSVLTPGADGLLWIGTWGGGVNLIRMADPTRVTHLELGDYTRLTNYVGSLAYDSINGGLWIGANDGIFFYNLQAQRVEIPFEGNDAVRGCIGALIDSHGRLWMGSISGTCVIDLKSRAGGKGYFKMRHLRNKLDRPESGIIEKMSCFCEGRDGTIWIGSNGYGLYRRVVSDDGQESFENLTIQDGLANNAVKGIVEDDRQRLWITTTNGLSVYDTRTRTFINYTTADGLVSNQFYWNSIIRGSDGTLYTGTEHGLTVIKGENPEADDAGHLSFTRLLVENQEVGTLSDYLDEDIAIAEKVRLSESDRSFTIEFSALTYGGEAQGIYSYRMKGLDRGWTQLRPGEHSVRYSKLPAGSYTFEVRYAPVQADGEDSVIAIDVEVSPYFWKSWWFLTLVFLLLAVLAFYQIRRRVELLKKREAERLLTPLRKALSESSDPEQLQVRITNILDNQQRYRESYHKSVEADKQAVLHQQKPFMVRAMELMEKNYMNSEFGVPEFCEGIGMSRSLVSKRLNAETGQSTGQFIRSYRLNVARELLVKNESNRNITEIAYRVGFNDPKYFTRCFTRQYGTSPSTFNGAEPETSGDST